MAATAAAVRAVPGPPPGVSLSPLRSTGCRGVPVLWKDHQTQAQDEEQCKHGQFWLRHSQGGPRRANRLTRRPAWPSAAAAGVGSECATAVCCTKQCPVISNLRQQELRYREHQRIHNRTRTRRLRLRAVAESFLRFWRPSAP